MCGIAGLISRKTGSGPKREEETLQLILKKIRHRGPDGTGIWKSENLNHRIWLGHNRLSIIDVEGGAQPMSTASGDCVITYNGELFNFLDLKKDLHQDGVAFSTRSDTEVLASVYERRGVQGLNELNGMFAFAIWDRRSGSLTLARDRYGIKPLYYAMLEGGGLVFSSELSSLLGHPDVSRQISVEGLSSYFFSDSIHAPYSIFRGVNKLAPGNYLRWENGKLFPPQSYVEKKAKVSFGAPPDASQALWKALESAVQRQLISDVPVGVFLSGGIDSSSIAACASRLSKTRIKTFSIGFENETYDESGFARLVANQIQSEHTEKRFSETELLDSFQRATSSLDEPLADPSLLPTFLLAELAAKSVKVALGGDGGDELLAGYPTYWAHSFASLYGWTPEWFKTSLAKFFRKLPIQEHYQSLEWKLKKFTGRWDSDPLRRHLLWMASIDLRDLDRAMSGRSVLPAFFNEIPAEPASRKNAVLDSYLDLDFVTYMPGSVLTKVDRASMAHSLEVRPPFLDNELVDFIRALPPELKLRRGQGKYLLKKAAQPYLPKEIIYRKKKGFGIPLAAFLRGPLRPHLERSVHESPLWGVLNQEVFQAWFDAHQNRTEDRSRPLWALLVLDTWFKKEGLDAKI